MSAAKNVLVVTGKGRFCYLNAWEPRAKDGRDKKVYSVTFVFPKSDAETFKNVTNAIQEAYEAGGEVLRGNGKNVPAIDQIKSPLRDGDEERPDDEIFAGCWFINATSMYAPGVVDKDLNVIVDKDQLYSGCYGRVQISFYAYNRQGNRGIACGLRHLQKLEDGENLGGATSAIEAFKNV